MSPVIVQPSTLPTQQAAELLNISHEFMLSLLDQGVIPSRGAAPERRILMQDLIRYKAHLRQISTDAVDQLTKEAQALHLGY